MRKSDPKEDLLPPMLPPPASIPPEVPEPPRSILLRFFVWLLSFFPHRTIYRDTEKYLTRYYLLGGARTNGSTDHKWLPFNLFVHCFHSSDVPPAHNHPWTWARSLILWGSYRETRLLDSPIKLRPTLTSLDIEYWRTWLTEIYKPGDINRIDRDTYHYVELLDDEVWTLFLVGKNVQGWGFLTENGHVRARDWINRNKPSTSGVDVVDDD